MWKKFNKGVKKMGRVYEQLINLLKKRKDSVKIRNRVNLDKLRSRSWVLLEKIFGTHSENELKRIYPIVDRIEAMDEEMQKNYPIQN